jgi:glycosyltransferase involved in cell wall biosynthesis
MLYRVHKESLWHGTAAYAGLQREKILAANADLACDKAVAMPARKPCSDWATLLEQEEGTDGILLALPFATVGGAERLFEYLIDGWMAAGLRVVVVTSLVLGENLTDTRWRFEKLTPHVYSLPHLFSGREELWPEFLSYLLDRYRIRTAMMAGCEYLYHLLPELRKHFPELLIVDQLFNDEVHLRNNRRYSEEIDLTIVPSQPFAARLISEFGESPERVAVIPHGVDIPNDTSDARVREAKERAGLPEQFLGRYLVGFFGRMSEEKGPDLFIEIARVLAADPNFAFVMTGDGPERSRVLELIDRYGLADRVHAPGFVDDPKSSLMAVDVVVVPSRLDGMPLIVLEAQGANKPVVAARVGSIPAMVTHDRTGLLCARGDVGAFAAAIRRLYEAPGEARRLAEAGRLSMAREHGSDAMKQRYRDAFRAAARSRESACSPRG